MAYVSSFIRHLLAGLGAYLLAKNIASPDVINAFVDSSVQVVIGLISYLLAQYWSVKKISKDQ